MITNIYSKRQKRLRGEYSDVYQYENFPIVFRRQIIMIVQDVIGIERDGYYGVEGSNDKTVGFYSMIYKTLCKEYGIFDLHSANFKSISIFEYLLKCDDYERCLDIIELFGIAIHILGDEYKFKDLSIDSIQEINERFKEHGLGYQFEPEASEIIRVDSQFVHSEVVKPVLKLLANNDLYQGVNDEFLSAHEHYRHQKYKECINDCLKSFESIMKAIHTKRGWEYKQTDACKKLIDSCISNGLIPEYLLSQYQSITNLLSSGLPTIRNKETGHGKGIQANDVSEHLASYALHLTATNLLFLAQCEERL